MMAGVRALVRSESDPWPHRMRFKRIGSGQGLTPAASPGVGHVLLDDLGVGVVEHHGAARRAHELGRALDHAVTLALGLGLDLARARHLEALFGAALGLQLGHLALLMA